MIQRFTYLLLIFCTSTLVKSQTTPSFSVYVAPEMTFALPKPQTFQAEWYQQQLGFNFGCTREFELKQQVSLTVGVGFQYNRFQSRPNFIWEDDIDYQLGFRRMSNIKISSVTLPVHALIGDKESILRFAGGVDLATQIYYDVTKIFTGGEVRETSSSIFLNPAIYAGLQVRLKNETEPGNLLLEPYCQWLMLAYDNVQGSALNLGFKIGYLL